MAKVESTDRKALYKILWIACREALLRAGIETDEAIRARRAWCCWEATAGRGEGERTEDYAKLSIIELREAVRLANPGYKKHEPASEQMRGMLMYHAMYCAIHFVDLEGVQYRRERGGTAITGEALRGVLWAIFQRREVMPNSLFLLLCNCWINSHMNEFLYEGGMRGKARKENEFYITSLTVTECQALIDRFRKICQNLPPAPVARVADISTN